MKAIEGYGGDYLITSVGMVYSVKYGNKRVLKQQDNGSGYMAVNLSRCGVAKRVYVHRLVAEAFLDNSENLPEVNHKNLDKSDNRACNLEWVTRSQNAIHWLSARQEERASRIKTTRVTTQKMKIAHNMQKRRVAQYSLTGELIAEHFGVNEASKNTSINASLISLASRNKILTAGGFKWSQIK